MGPHRSDLYLAVLELAALRGFPMRVETRDAGGNPICYVCHVPVAEEGAACSASCYLHFAAVVSGADAIVDIRNYTDHTAQEWFTTEEEA